MNEPRFDRSFIWGIATSAFQIEGGRFEDGKGESIWDRFSDQGRLRDPGDVACDHFHRWEEDLDLLAALGVGAYRFSVAWTRVIPDGYGEVNRRGLDFYSRIVDGLDDRGITPYLTLYHWDLPQALQDKGGWVSRSTVDAFARYAEVVAGTLGDRVSHWITHNEPWVATMLGHKDGLFAPGVADWGAALAAGHHILVSHGRAVEAIRSQVSSPEVGVALDCRPVQASSDSEADQAAARHLDGYRNRWFFDPVFGKGYPEDMVDAYLREGKLDPDVIVDGDLDVIAAPIDFLGLNYYTTVTVRAGEEPEEGVSPPAGDPPPDRTEMGWLIDPDGLGDYLVSIHNTYRPPSILITENGASYSDGPDDAGVIDDRRRIDYLRRHLEAVAGVRAHGVPVNGYFVWSLLDNLEWLEGFSQRFGLVWVDRRTGTRIPKRSFEWYSQVVRTGTLP